MKEINPIGIRLGYSLLWKNLYVFYNYSCSYKNYLTRDTRLSDIITHSAFFFIFFKKKLMKYFQFYNKKITKFLHFLYMSNVVIPTNLYTFSTLLDKNRNFFSFVISGVLKYEKKIYSINLLLFYFLLVKKYLHSKYEYFNANGIVFFEINFTSIISRFKLFRKKYFFFKKILLRKNLCLIKSKNMKKLSRNYWLSTRTDFLNIPQSNFLYFNTSRLFFYKCPHLVFKKQKFFLKRIKRSSQKKKRKIFSKKFYYIKFFLKKRGRYFKYKKNKRLFFWRVRKVLLLKKLFRKKILSTKKISNFPSYLKFYVLKQLLFKKLLHMRKRIYFMRFLFPNGDVSSTNFLVLKFNAIKNYYFTFLKKIFFMKKFQFTFLRSQKVFVLYTLYFKYWVESIFSKMVGYPIKLYFKNFYKYVKININLRKNFWLLRKKSFLKNLISRYFFYLEGVNVLLLGVSTRNASLLILYLSIMFERNKQHFKILKYFRILILEFFTKIPIFLGIKLRISGKFHGKARALSKTLYIYRNILPILTFKSSISYKYKAVDTFTGIFGIHLWLYYK